MSEKLCLFCTNCGGSVDYDRGYYEGDCYPSGQIDCAKGHWKVYWGGDGFVDFRRHDLAEAIQMAKTCLDYEQVKT